jgi:DUF971 family protein
MGDPWPSEVRLATDRRSISVNFEQDGLFQIPAELLRVESPSAEVQGHGPGQKVEVLGKENVRISRIEPVGHYAVRLIFDDGHSTGLYTWAILHRLGKLARDKRGTSQ